MEERGGGDDSRKAAQDSHGQTETRAETDGPASPSMRPGLAPRWFARQSSWAERMTGAISAPCLMNRPAPFQAHRGSTGVEGEGGGRIWIYLSKKLDTPRAVGARRSLA